MRKLSDALDGFLDRLGVEAASTMSSEQEHADEAALELCSTLRDVSVCGVMRLMTHRHR